METNTTTEITAAQARAWLQKLIGKWELLPGEQSTGGETPDWTETGRSLGDNWVLLEGEGTMPDGTPGSTLVQLGFETEKQRIVGSWIGSMMTTMWVYDGELDLENNVLTLNCEGPDFTDEGEIRPFRDIIEMKGPDERLWRAERQAGDGTWEEIMSATHRRMS